MQNVSGSVNGACTAATPAADRWKCFMAQYTFPHVKTPAFVVNSFYDAWQWGAVLEMPCKEPGCASKAGCPAGATAALEGLRAGMIGNVSAAIAGGGTQHSGFLYACVTHCGQFSHDDRWAALSVHGRWVMTHPCPSHGSPTPRLCHRRFHPCRTNGTWVRHDPPVVDDMRNSVFRHCINNTDPHPEP